MHELVARTMRYDTSATRLVCLSAAGFDAGLREAAQESSDVVLVARDDIYGP